MRKNTNLALEKKDILQNLYQ